MMEEILRIAKSIEAKLDRMIADSMERKNAEIDARHTERTIIDSMERKDTELGAKVTARKGLIERAYAKLTGGVK